jgi:hypothetical protein
MFEEVVASKTIAGLSNKSEKIICGETAALKWIQNGVVNNQQNYIEATAVNECKLTDSTTATIQSIKKVLPPNAVAAKYFYSNTSGKHLHHTDEKYYGYLTMPVNNVMIKDTFYVARDSVNISGLSSMPVVDSLPRMSEGSAVFNARGELIGIVRQQQVSLIPLFIKQINKH